MDLRDADEALLAEAQRLRLQAPGTRTLALLAPHGAAPPDCDSLLTEPFYLVDVVRWCARAAVAPLTEGLLADLAAGLAHEIGNPLTALLLQLEMLRTDDQITTIRDHLQLIEDSSQRIQDVLRDVASASERRPVEVTTTRLSLLMREAKAALRARSSVLAKRVHVDCEDESVQAEPALVSAALADLWQYLLLAGDTSDKLVVAAGALDSNTVSIRAEAHVPRLPDDSASRLFTPLWARQALGLPGTLSLTSARSAFLRHGGELRACAQRGQILTVEAILPRSGLPSAAPNG
jgi:signal transduction histidine kinase